MSGAPPLEVSVVYALPDRFIERKVRVSAGATLGDALAASGLIEELRLDAAALRLGVYGRLRTLDHLLAAGDRVEIYRPLLMAPNEARLARARPRKRQRA